MAEWQCFEQKIVEIGETIAGALLDSSATMHEIRQELHELSAEVRRIADIKSAEHRPQQVKWHAGTPTQEGN